MSDTEEQLGFQATDFWDADRERILDLLHKHGAIIFRRSCFSREAHLAFAEQFGELKDKNRVGNVDRPVDHPLIVNIANAAANFAGSWTPGAGREWHADGSYTERPIRYSTFRAIKTGPDGARTYFVDSEVMYNKLSMTDKMLLRECLAVRFSYGRKEQVVQPMIKANYQRAGRYYLNFSPATKAILGKSDQDTRLILNHLYELVEENAVFLTWFPGDLLMWDNKRVLHRADTRAEVDDSPRHAEKINIKGAESGLLVIGEQY